MVSAFWSDMEQFHRAVHGSSPNGEEGLQSFLYFRSLLERDWKDVDSGEHPFRHWVAIASEYHYTRLIQLRKKFELVDSMNGFKSRTRRLADKRQYLSAMAEIETAARLRLAGIDISFPKDKSGNTPDILVEEDGCPFWVEVTCVNPPQFDFRFSDLLGEIMSITMSKRVTIGGFGLERLTKVGLQQIKDKVNLAAGEVAGKDELRMVNVRGKATLYVGSGSKVADIPDECKGTFRVWSSNPRSHIHRVIDKISEKGEKNYLGGVPGFLVLYDKMMDPRNVNEIFGSQIDDLGVVMATFPQLSGMALVVPYDFGTLTREVLFTISPDRDFKKYALPDMSTENLVLWSNKHADIKLPSTIYDAFMNYPTAYAKYLNEKNRLSP